MNILNSNLKNPEDIRVLVGCERSGVVRKSFEALGFDAYSCDIQPDAERSNRHFQCDIAEVLDDDWDLLAVFHPPCTRLCNSGVRWLKVAPTKLDPNDYTDYEVALYETLDEEGRLAFMWDQLDKGAAFFSTLWNAPIPHRAVENPIMHKYAKERIENFKPAQYVQPWWFGDPAFKATGFHVQNLPKLKPTNKLTPPKKGTPEHTAWSMIHHAPPGPERHNIRSQTFKGIGDAVAQQYGSHVVGYELELAA